MSSDTLKFAHSFVLGVSDVAAPPNAQREDRLLEALLGPAHWYWGNRCRMTRSSNLMRRKSTNK
jgi:hypothetical protein